MSMEEHLRCARVTIQNEQPKHNEGGDRDVSRTNHSASDNDHRQESDAACRMTV